MVFHAALTQPVPLTLTCSIANDGTKFYLLTNKAAPQYKLITVDIADPPEKRISKDLISEDKDAHLQDVLTVNGDYAAVVYKRNVRRRSDWNVVRQN